MASKGQLSEPKLELQLSNRDKLEITNYKHQITNKFQISNKIKSQLFGVLNFGHCDLPFDMAQGGKVVSLSNHLVFVFCYLKFFITETRTLKPETLIF
jgi:hypothetical protein